MSDQRFYPASHRSGDVTLDLSYCCFGSRAGDIYLDIYHTGAAPFEKSVAATQEPAVVIETVSALRPLDIRPPDLGGGQYPTLWSALHGLIRTLSPEFKKSTQPCKGAALNAHKKTVLPETGVFVIPDDDDPRESQAVMTLAQDTLAIHTQTAIGYPAYNDHAAEWHIHRSPTLTIARAGLRPEWENVAKAFVFESARPRVYPEWFQPFDQVLIKDPNTRWICAR